MHCSIMSLFLPRTIHTDFGDGVGCIGGRRWGEGSVGDFVARTMKLEVRSCFGGAFKGGIL